MVFVTKMRWRIERDYQDLKQDFRLSPYEGRALSIAANAFLMAQRLKAGRSDVGGKKTLPNGRHLPFPRITSLGVVQRAQRHARKCPGALPPLQVDEPKITFVTQ